MNDRVYINGGCHCRAIRFKLNWPADEAEGLVITARKCGCSFCTRIDGTWTSHPNAELEVTQASAHEPIRYRFGTKTADFLICGHCGMTPLVVCALDDVTYAVVNTNTFDEVDDAGYSLAHATADFEGEDTEARLARRKIRWISKVRWRVTD